MRWSEKHYRELGSTFSIKKIAAILFVVLSILLIAILLFRQNRGPQGTIQRRQEITVKWMVPGEKFKSTVGVFDEFNKRLKQYFPDTTVEFEVIPKEMYRKKWDMKMATNEGMDLAWIGTDLFNYVEEVKKGSFMALGYLLDAYGSELQSSVPGELWLQQQYEGNTYSIPVPGILYRKGIAIVTKRSIVDHYGTLSSIGSINRAKEYTDKECFDAIEELLRRIKQKSVSELGAGVSYQSFMQLADKGYEGIYGSGSPFVIRIFDDDDDDDDDDDGDIGGNVSNDSNDGDVDVVGDNVGNNNSSNGELVVYNKYKLPSWKTYFQTMWEWYRKGYIRSDVKEILNPSSDDGKVNGTVVFIDDYGKNGAVADMLPTEFEKVVEPLENYKYISYGAYRNSIVIPKSADQPQRAMELVNLLFSEKGNELYQLLVNGIEGVHYIKGEEDLIQRKLDDKGMPLYMLPGYALGNTFHNYETSKGQLEQIRVYNDKAILSPLTGFELDTRMFILELTKVNLIVDEYLEKLSQGTADNWSALYNEFVSAMDKAGSEKIIREIQKQLNQFVRNKSISNRNAR